MKPIKIHSDRYSMWCIWHFVHVCNDIWFSLAQMHPQPALPAAGREQAVQLQSVTTWTSLDQWYPTLCPQTPTQTRYTSPLMQTSIASCVCVCVHCFGWFTGAQICIMIMDMTEVLQYERGLWGHCLCPHNSKGLKKNILNGVFFENLKISKVFCRG